MAVTEEQSVGALAGLGLSAFGLVDGRIYKHQTFCTIGRGGFQESRHAVKIVNTEAILLTCGCCMVLIGHCTVMNWSFEDRLRLVVTGCCN